MEGCGTLYFAGFSKISIKVDLNPVTLRWREHMEEGYGTIGLWRGVALYTLLDSVRFPQS